MLELAGIFGDGMVLQRDRECAIWGKEDEAEKVSVFLDGKEYSSPVENGTFLVTLPPHDIATGLTITVSGSREIELRDVCFGDVFYLAGQSNMELPVYRTMDISREEVEASDYPYIRQYRVTPQYSLDEERPAVLPGNPWTAAVPGKIGEMSAAGFYCARRIYEEKKIPIGLVLGAQGGSTIESWMPEKLLSEFGDFSEAVDPFRDGDALVRYLENREREIASWRDELNEPEEIEKKYISGIPGIHEDFIVPGLLLNAKGNGHVGVVWFYKDFELSEEPDEEAFLYLGDLIDADQTYVNGVLVGATGYRYPPRKYPFSGKILRKGMNRITVRLIVENGDGGFVAEHPYYIETGKEKHQLLGKWTVAYGKKAERELPHFLLGQEVPTSLYTASVLPLRNYTFRGLWWYQGESNSDDPDRYDEKFAAMIRNWRALYNQDLPLICVEMPDYQDPLTGEMPVGWESIQAQQRAAAEQIPDCQVVRAKDLGTPLELHPQRKSELGARMADVAKALYF